MYVVSYNSQLPKEWHKTGVARSALERAENEFKVKKNWKNIK